MPCPLPGSTIHRHTNHVTPRVGDGLDLYRFSGPTEAATFPKSTSFLCAVYAPRSERNDKKSFFVKKNLTKQHDNEQKRMSLD